MPPSRPSVWPPKGAPTAADTAYVTAVHDAIKKAIDEVEMLGLIAQNTANPTAHPEKTDFELATRMPIFTFARPSGNTLRLTKVENITLVPLAHIVDMMPPFKTTFDHAVTQALRTPGRKGVVAYIIMCDGVPQTQCVSLADKTIKMPFPNDDMEIWKNILQQSVDEALRKSA